MWYSEDDESTSSGCRIPDVFLGLAHSVLGERYILIRLFRREDLPKLLGSDWFTRRTLRFAWHLTTVAWWGMAAQLVVLSLRGPVQANRLMLLTIAIVFLASSLITLLASRGKHFAWVVFLAIAVLTFSALPPAA